LRSEILIIGRGGQGILVMGRVLGMAAVRNPSFRVASTETYGSETRGTESRVDLIITDEGEIDYVRVRRPSIFVVMYPLNVEKYLGMLTSETVVFLNSTYINELQGVSVREIYRAPYTDIAEKETGSARPANMVALGHVVGRTGIVKPEDVEEAIKEVIPREWVEASIKAFRLGLKL